MSNLIIKTIQDWTDSIELFARMTNMTASLYLANGKRACGPLGNNPILNVIKSSGKFNEGNLAHYSEQREVYKVVVSGKPSTFDFSKSLRIDAIPIKNRNEVIAVVMLGWVFDHFPDPVECERLSRDLELPPNQLWQMARLQSPVSEEKFSVYKDMLSLLLSTLLHQIVALQKVQEASRVKDELLSIVSHELKTPLSSLLLRIQMLKSHRVDPEKMDSFLNSMEVNARMESKLIDDLLDAARMVTGKYQFDPKLIDLKSTVASAIQVISESARERDIKIKYESTENVASIYGDPIRLSQAVINLINNSIKFSPHGETITVTLKSLSDEYELSIIDNGQGIEQNFIPQMFEIFSQPPRKTGSISNGLGLGMALVKNIIDLHNGKIEVLSLGENLGTKIVIHFPKDEFLKN